MKMHWKLAFAALMIASTAKATVGSDGSTNAIDTANSESQINAVAGTKTVLSVDDSIALINAKLTFLDNLQESLENVEDTQGVMRDIGQTVTTSRELLGEIQTTKDATKAQQLVGELSQTSLELATRAKALSVGN